jgi:hypothetical protein
MVLAQLHGDASTVRHARCADPLATKLEEAEDNALREWLLYLYYRRPFVVITLIVTAFVSVAGRYKQVKEATLAACKELSTFIRDVGSPDPRLGLRMRLAR